MQNIPSHTKEIRLMFTAGTRIKDTEVENNSITVSAADEVEIIPNVWKRADELAVGDTLCSIEDDGVYSQRTITNIFNVGNDIKFFFN